MGGGARRGRLVALGEGVCTVPEVARILRPTVTVHKIRRWLHKGPLLAVCSFVDPDRIVGVSCLE